MAATPMLTCKQCNYENEAERVYCHNCGAKLDRSILPKEPAKVTKENQEKTAKRIQKMVSPARGFFTNWQRTLPETIAAAIAIAALIQIARPPAVNPPPVPSKDDLLAAPPLMEQIGDLQMQPTSQSRQLPEEMINVYLAGAVKSKGDTSDDYFKFERAYVNLGKDVIKITSEQSAFGYPVYASASYKLAIAGGKLVATNVGGSLGRLPIHPMLMEYSGFAFQQLWDALQKEHDAMDRMQSVSVEPGVFVFTTKPHG